MPYYNLDISGFGKMDQSAKAKSKRNGNDPICASDVAIFYLESNGTSSVGPDEIYPFFNKKDEIS